MKKNKNLWMYMGGRFISLIGSGIQIIALPLYILDLTGSGTLMGFFNAFVNTPISTNLQNLVPEEMRSRFFAILGMFSQGSIPLGALLFGILLDITKYYNLLTVVNIVSVLVAAVFLIGACDEAYQAKESVD